MQILRQVDVMHFQCIHIARTLNHGFEPRVLQHLDLLVDIAPWYHKLHMSLFIIPQFLFRIAREFLPHLTFYDFLVTGMTQQCSNVFVLRTHLAEVLDTLVPHLHSVLFVVLQFVVKQRRKTTHEFLQRQFLHFKSTHIVHVDNLYKRIINRMEIPDEIPRLLQEFVDHGQCRLAHTRQPSIELRRQHRGVGNTLQLDVSIVQQNHLDKVFCVEETLLPFAGILHISTLVEKNTYVLDPARFLQEMRDDVLRQIRDFLSVLRRIVVEHPVRIFLSHTWVELNERNLQGGMDVLEDVLQRHFLRPIFGMQHQEELANTAGRILDRGLLF